MDSMKRYTTELIVGVFVVIGVIVMAYISVTLGDIELFGRRGYTVYALFESTSGLKEGADIEIAGVLIGKVEKIRLDGSFALVEMRIDSGVNITEDVIASVRTRGIIGERFIKLTPGGSDESLKPGDKIIDTESSVDIEELISKYIFSLEKDKN